MRSTIFTRASVSARDRMIRSSVWQCVQFLTEAFCCSLPGRLANHSALESCAARSAVLRSFRSAVAALPAATSTVLGLWRSYPAARMRKAYEPGGSFEEGNLYWPRSSLTTVMVIVDPAFLALTSTPSIGPSSTELTRPERVSARARRQTSANSTAILTWKPPISCREARTRTARCRLWDSADPARPPAARYADCLRRYWW